MSEKNVVELKSKSDFDQAIGHEDKVVVIDCYATWCGPCRLIAPKVEQMSAQYADNALFYKIDVDDVPTVAAELGVRAMPTFYIFKNGEKCGEVVGANPSALKAAIEKNLP